MELPKTIGHAERTQLGQDVKPRPTVKLLDERGVVRWNPRRSAGARRSVLTAVKIESGKPVDPVLSYLGIVGGGVVIVVVSAVLVGKVVSSLQSCSRLLLLDHRRRCRHKG